MSRSFGPDGPAGRVWTAPCNQPRRPRSWEQAGWARSVGGAGPYLTLFARAGTGRAEADQAVAEVEIHELPAARGCTYLVPASDFALARAVGREASASHRSSARTAHLTGGALFEAAPN